MKLIKVWTKSEIIKLYIEVKKYNEKSKYL